MSKILDWEISDDTREAMAEKLGLEYRALLEIPYLCYYSSNSTRLCRRIWLC